MEETLFWHVVYTRPRWEKRVARILDEKGIENYCPLNKVEKQWSDRKKIIFEPLFKGYVFIRITDDKKWNIKLIDGIISYVYFLGKPAVVRDEEIETIKKFLNEFKSIEVSDNQLKEKDAVIINRGVLMNYKGVVLEILGNKARVKIDSMGVSLSAVFDKKSLTH